MSQQPLFVPASDGWYARPGDPPGVVRHWDGKAWQCEFRGPIKDHFDHLRSMDPQTRTDADRELLKRLTRDVSDIEDLVLAEPSANPPLVQIAAPPPYIPPPVATYGTGPGAPTMPTYSAPPPPAAPVYMGPQPPAQSYQPQAYAPQQYAAPQPYATSPAPQPYGQAAPAPLSHGTPPGTPLPYSQPTPPSHTGRSSTLPYAANPATQAYVPQAAPPPQYVQQPPQYAPQQQAAPQQYAPQLQQPYAPTYQPGPPTAPTTKKKKGGSWLRRGLAVLVVVALGTAVRFGYTAVANGTLLASTTAALAVSSCVTLSYPSGASDAKSVAWAKSECTTPADAAVSYVVVSKLAGAAQCDPDSQFVQTLSTGNTVTYTYCLMENLVAGQCVYEDDKGFLFDVPCSDTRALVKISQRVDKGAGVECAAGEGSWRFPAGNRTYCLSKPKI